MKNVLLERAAEIVENGWCKSAFARDRRGRSVRPDDPKAAKFCALGALERADALYPFAGDYWLAVERLSRYLHDHGLVRPGNSETAISRWNDMKSTTKKDVVKALRGAAR